MRDVGGEAEWAEEAVRFEEDEARCLRKCVREVSRKKKKKNLT